MTDGEGYVLGGLTCPANESDMSKLKELLERVKLSEGNYILGDKGFASKKNREYIKSKGYKDLIMHKKPKGKEIPIGLKLLNKIISKIRYVVEQTIGILKKHLGLERFRYIGRCKNEMELYLSGIVLNLKKAARKMC